MTYEELQRLQSEISFLKKMKQDIEMRLIPLQNSYYHATKEGGKDEQ